MCQSNEIKNDGFALRVDKVRPHSWGAADGAMAPRSGPDAKRDRDSLSNRKQKDDDAFFGINSSWSSAPVIFGD